MRDCSSVVGAIGGSCRCLSASAALDSLPGCSSEIAAAKGSSESAAGAAGFGRALVAAIDSGPSFSQGLTSRTSCCRASAGACLTTALAFRECKLIACFAFQRPFDSGYGA